MPNVTIMHVKADGSVEGKSMSLHDGLVFEESKPSKIIRAYRGTKVIGLFIKYEAWYYYPVSLAEYPSPEEKTEILKQFEKWRNDNDC